MPHFVAHFSLAAMLHFSNKLMNERTHRKEAGGVGRWGEGIASRVGLSLEQLWRCLWMLRQPRLCPVDFMYCLLYVYLDCHKTHGDYDCSICGYSSVVVIFHCAVARLQGSYLV